MKSLQDLIEEKKLAKQNAIMTHTMTPKSDTSWLGSISGMFADFFKAISDKVWTVSIKELSDFKWPDMPKMETPVINIPKQIVDVHIPDIHIPDVNVSMKDFKIPAQEVNVNIPPVRVNIPDVVVDYREPEQMIGFSLGYDNRGELDTITEEYKSGKRVATKKFNKWVINDNRRNT